MVIRAERALGVAFLIVGAGLLTAIFGVAATTQTPGYDYLGGPCMQMVQVPGFDPWTGERHGAVLETSDCLSEAGVTLVQVRRITYPIPDDLPDRPIVTFPMGFVVGCVGAIAVLSVPRLRRRSDRDGNAETPATVAA